MKNLTSILLRPLLCLAVCFFSFSTLPAQAQLPDSVKHYLDKVITITQKESFYTKKVNWASLKEEMYAKATHAQHVSDLRDAFQLMLERLGDSHGGIYFAGSKGAEYRLPSTRPAHPQQDTVEALLRKHTFKTTAQVIDGKWGCVLIPSIGGIGSKQITENASALQKAVEGINKDNIKGWIIDLRYNPGGNIYAVGTGMAAFVQEGALQQYINADRQQAFTIRMKDGNVESEGFRPTELEPVKNKVPDGVPVIVLVSRHTASAGEGLSYLLKQRKNTLLLGEETGGYCSGTNYQVLDKKIGLNLTTAYPIDKNGNVFDSLQPDIEFQGKYGLGNLSEDEFVQEALAMLKDSSKKMYQATK